MTVDEINSDNLKIDKKIEILLSSDTSTGLSKAMGLALISFPDALRKNPDAVLLLVTVMRSLVLLSLPPLHVFQ